MADSNLPPLAAHDYRGLSILVAFDVAEVSH